MTKKVVHVAVAVIRDAQQRILLAKRAIDQHQGGLWEFPGGKVEAGETVEQALVREIKEELGIQVTACQPLIQIPHHYPDKSVFLDVYEVSAFSGEAEGKEGQPICWVTADELDQYEFPAANKPIVKACQLPQAIFITPAMVEADLLKAALKAINTGADGIMLRAHHLNDNEYKALYHKFDELCRQHKVLLIANRSCALAENLSAEAAHLSVDAQAQLHNREQFSGRFLGASCHSLAEAQAAFAKGVDYITLSPLKPTRSHPDAMPLGWDQFMRCVSDLTLPVYALGGVAQDDFAQARACGAQGIAAINAWLEA